MSRSSYKSLQRAIARDDKHSIESRWEYGRAILADPKKMAASGKSLRHGATEALIADAQAVGSALTEREIQRRIQCARTYKTINEIRHAVSDFDTWHDLVQAGFPSVYVDDIAPTEEMPEQGEDERDEFEQLGLFPAMVKNVSIETASVAQIVAYTDDMTRMTQSYASTDAKRRAHVAEIVAVCDGDLSIRYVDALDMLARAKASETA